MTQRIARMDSDELLANADEIIAAAQAKLSALCHGDESWRMSVPVQDGDSDVPLGAAIRLAARLRDELTAERLRLDWLNEFESPRCIQVAADPDTDDWRVAIDQRRSQCSGYATPNDEVNRG
jgi:hypothetical protein